MSACFSPPAILTFIEAATSATQLHQAHAHMIKTGLIQDPFAASRLITATTTTTNLTATAITYTHSIFTHLQDPNPYTYNTMIRAHTNSTTPQNALLIFLQMLCNDISPDKSNHTCLKVLMMMSWYSSEFKLCGLENGTIRSSSEPYHADFEPPLLLSSPNESLQYESSSPP
ncbi:hypothetical protein RJ639_019617 [Escallonia herrerae]|uniref:Uncharacterized protein n=1 Tax=Escallonia herrerae TaxID=1293975 RepID=A0AA88VBG0_9ASTE|nr:hypothetical protein RJ639_019617 [Escallonia herrerae]